MTIPLQTVVKAQRIIVKANKDLGPLSHSWQINLLADNMPNLSLKEIEQVLYQLDFWRKF